DSFHARRRDRRRGKGRPRPAYAGIGGCAWSLALSPQLAGGEPPSDAGCELVARCAMGTHWRTWVLHPLCCLGLEWGDPTPHGRQGGTSLFGSHAGGGRPAETKEARSVVALSRVPRGERGAPVSPPAAGQVVSELKRSHQPLRSHSGRLSGLLSGCPPTDTRPQARAKL